MSHTYWHGGILARTIPEHLNPSDAQKNSKSLTKAYGGYVHGTSVHIIDMMFRNVQGKFEHLFFGIPYSATNQDMREHFDGFIYGGICLLICVSSRVGFVEVMQSATDLKNTFERKSGVLGEETPDQLLKRMKQQPKK